MFSRNYYPACRASICPSQTRVHSARRHRFDYRLTVVSTQSCQTRRSPNKDEQRLTFREYIVEVKSPHLTYRYTSLFTDAVVSSNVRNLPNRRVRNHYVALVLAFIPQRRSFQAPSIRWFPPNRRVRGKLRLLSFPPSPFGYCTCLHRLDTPI